MSLTTPWCLPSAGGSFCFFSLTIHGISPVWPLNQPAAWGLATFYCHQMVGGLCFWLDGAKHQWAMSCTSCSGLKKHERINRFGHKGLAPFRQTQHIWKMLTDLRIPVHPRLAHHVFFAKFHTGYKDPCTFPDRSVYTFETKLRSLTDTLRWPGCLIIARPIIDLFLAKFLDLCTLQLPPATQLMAWFKPTLLVICLCKSLPETPSFNMWHYTYTIIHTHRYVYIIIYIHVYDLYMTSRTYIAWLTSCVQHLRCSWASTTAWWRCSHPLQGRNWLAPSGSSEAGCSTMQHQKLDDFDGDWNHQFIWVVYDIAAYFMENGWEMAQIWIDVSEKMENNHSKLLNYQRVPQFMACYDILWQFMTKKN